MWGSDAGAPQSPCCLALLSHLHQMDLTHSLFFFPLRRWINVRRAGRRRRACLGLFSLGLLFWVVFICQCSPRLSFPRSGTKDVSDRVGRGRLHVHAMKIYFWNKWTAVHPELEKWVMCRLSALTLRLRPFSKLFNQSSSLQLFSSPQGFRYQLTIALNLMSPMCSNLSWNLHHY